MATGHTEAATSGATPDRLMLGRRTFLQWSAVVGGAVGLASCADPGVGPQNALVLSDQSKDKVVWNACLVNCGSRCPLRFQVRDDQIVRVLPDNTGDDEIGTQQIRACVRGRSIRQRVYNPDRLKTPLRRVGKARWRGVGGDLLDGGVRHDRQEPAQGLGRVRQ